MAEVNVIQRTFLLTAIVAMLATSGCVVVPTPGVFAVRHVVDKVGTPDSKAPLKLGVSDRSDVFRLLGKPDGDARPMASSEWMYSNDVLTGYWVWLWPFVHGGPISAIYDTSGLHISFGPDGKISGYNTWY